jgi:hypothetical protein
MHAPRSVEIRRGPCQSGKTRRFPSKALLHDSALSNDSIRYHLDRGAASLIVKLLGGDVGGIIKYQPTRAHACPSSKESRKIEWAATSGPLRSTATDCPARPVFCSVLSRSYNVASSDSDIIKIRRAVHESIVAAKKQVKLLAGHLLRSQHSLNDLPAEEEKNEQKL